MTTTIPNGGTRDSQDLYVGAVNEITVDQSNKEIRLHDGATPGGVRIANLDSLVNIFQQHSDELDGLLGFQPNAKGLVVRRGAATYALRQITSADGSLTVVEPRGFNGDFDFRLSDIVPGDHQWQGQQEFLDTIKADQGIIGDVEGDVTGNLTGNSTGAHTGDVDVRGATIEFDAAQIPQSAVNGLIAALTNLIVHVGTITMWGGSFADIPANWHLCDGTNGTPDLTDMFVMGTNTESEVFDSGGAVNHTHVGTVAADGEHLHTGDVGDTSLTLAQIPGHSHKDGVTHTSGSSMFCYGEVAAPGTPFSIDSNSADGNIQGNTSFAGGAGGSDTVAGAATTHSHGLDIALDGVHAHAVTIDSASHLPPWTKLAYIMKIS